ncbi:TetR/AcrR family transcriptional regulator [Roseovarius aestuarii]|nr:TetR/AcrR family transcriptional regulator [Roseovarius aestuarii]
MSNLETEILDAALRVFSRYGVKRTTMVDLCQEVDVSRQTLYNRFCNKDEILRGLIGRYTDTAIAEIDRGLQDAPGLGNKLDLVFDRMVVDGYDLVQTMPNAQDFVDGVNAVSKEALEVSAARFRTVIAVILAPHNTALERAGLDVADLSDFVQRAAKAAADQARDRAHLRQQLRILRQLCLRAASGDATDHAHSKENEDVHGS